MWLYENVELVEVPENIIGFVYIITNNLTGRKYIGKKLFTFAKRRVVKGKSKRFRAESDWKEYYGSNKELLHDVTTYGREHFSREILHLCRTKGQCSYYEAKIQFSLGVLEQPELYYNEQIRVRVHRSHLKL
jgi:Putative endonuclease segE, GIY-YIG domain